MAVRQTYNPNINIGARSGWCLQYVDDAISAPSRTPSARAAYLNELNAGRIDTGHAPIGVWVVGFLGFSRGQYVEYGHVFLMRKRGDGSIEIHDSEVHAGRRGIYNSIEEILGWFGVYGPDYLGFSYCCDGRQIAEYYDEMQPTDRKMEEDGNAREEPNTQSGVFQELTRGDVIAMKGYVTNGESIAGDTVWYVTARSGKYMSRQLFEDKDLHDLPDLTPKQPDPAPTPPPAPQPDYSNIILDVSNWQGDDVVNVFSRFAGVIIKAGHIGPSHGGDTNKHQPKMVQFAKAAGDKLLGLYWLPYFSEGGVAAEAARFIEAQKQVNAPLLFVDLEPGFEGTLEELKTFRNLVLQGTGKQVLTYGGNAIIQKLGLDHVEWYPNYGTENNYAHGALIHQFTDTGKIDGYGGNLDFSTVRVSIDELKALGKVTTPTPSEEPESPKPSEPDTKPSEPEKPQEAPEIKPEQPQKPEGDKPTGFLRWLSGLVVELAKLILGIFKKK